jgi:hypothetical protein
MFEFANQSGMERGFRIVLGLFLLALGWGGFVGGTVGVFFQYFGLVPLVTGLVGWCPLYAALGFSTCGGVHRARVAST